MKLRAKFLGLALIAGGTMFAQTRFSVGVGIGNGGYDYAPQGYVQQYQPPCPGPGYTWIDGYWGYQGGRSNWTNGFWQAPQRVIVPAYRYDARRDFRRDEHRDNRSYDRGNSFRQDDRGRRDRH